MNTEVSINLQDTQWQFEYVDHDRNIARAIVYDESGQFYFVRAERYSNQSLKYHRLL